MSRHGPGLDSDPDLAAVAPVIRAVRERAPLEPRDLMREVLAG